MADLGREKKNKSRWSNQLETWISLFFFAIYVSPSDQRLINEMATKMADQPLNQNGRSRPWKKKQITMKQSTRNLNFAIFLCYLCFSFGSTADQWNGNQNGRSTAKPKRLIQRREWTKKKIEMKQKTKQESDRSGGWEGVDTNRSAMTQRRYAVR